jgi:hypothetical protein
MAPRSIRPKRKCHTISSARAQQVQSQAALLAYIDVFWVLMLISVAVPRALILRNVKLGGPAPVSH